MTPASGPPIGQLEVGDPLPRAREAVVPERKLRQYTLNFTHPGGGPKARVFASVLGIRAADWMHLRDAILSALADAIISTVNIGAHATTYGVTLEIRGRNGRRAPIITAWRLHEGVPRLATVYVDLKSIST